MTSVTPGSLLRGSSFKEFLDALDRGIQERNKTIWIPHQVRDDGFFVFFSISIPRPESLRDCGVVHYSLVYHVLLQPNIGYHFNPLPQGETALYGKPDAQHRGIL